MRSLRLAAVPLVMLGLAGCTSGGPGASTTPTASAASPSLSTTAPATPTPATHATSPSASASRTPARTSGAARTSAARTTAASSTAPAPPPPRLPAVGPGLTVVLNPGHNGANWSHPAEINRQVPAGYGAYKACDTTGTNTNAGYAEHAFNWDVALRVRRLLQAHGVQVIMTRPDDAGVGPCVDQRAAIGNERGVDAVVSIHADGADSSGHGFHVCQDSRRPDGATAATARSSIELGRAVHDALAQASGLVPSTYIGNDGYYYRSDLAGLNLATNPATFLELGNMRNAGDAALQSSAAGRTRIARAVAAGILAYLARR